MAQSPAAGHPAPVRSAVSTEKEDGGQGDGRVDFKPYMPDDQIIPEFTPKAILVGVVFGLIFGASTVYLALKAGLTVSASIPIAVLSISLLKRLGGSTILENNIVQTIGSAGGEVPGGGAVHPPRLCY